MDDLSNINEQPALPCDSNPPLQIFDAPLQETDQILPLLLNEKGVRVEELMPSLTPDYLTTDVKLYIDGSDYIEEIEIDTSDTLSIGIANSDTLSTVSDFDFCSSYDSGASVVHSVDSAIAGLSYMSEDSCSNGPVTSSPKLDTTLTAMVSFEDSLVRFMKQETLNSDELDVDLMVPSTEFKFSSNTIDIEKCEDSLVDNNNYTCQQIQPVEVLANACNSHEDGDKSTCKHEQELDLKRPKNGFIRYAMRHRKSVAAQHPHMDNREISRILGIRWRKLLPCEKEEYEQAFRCEMERIKQMHPGWTYGSKRKLPEAGLWEPIPSRLRPRDALKRKFVPMLVRPFVCRSRPRLSSRRRRTKLLPPQSWVQCDRCNKWRRLPHSITTADLPDIWFCENNLAPYRNSCDMAEEQDNSNNMEDAEFLVIDELKDVQKDAHCKADSDPSCPYMFSESSCNELGQMYIPTQIKTERHGFQGNDPVYTLRDGRVSGPS